MAATMDNEDIFIREAVRAAMAREEELARRQTTEPLLKNVRALLSDELKAGISKKGKELHTTVPRRTMIPMANVGSEQRKDTQSSPTGCDISPQTTEAHQGTRFEEELSCSPKASTNATSEPIVESVPNVIRKRPRNLDTNWEALRKTLQPETPPLTHPKRNVQMNGKRAYKKLDQSSSATKATEVLQPPKCSMFVKGALRSGPAKPTKVIALDCEFVGVGEDGREDALARASVVNSRGEVLYDSFVRVDRHVVDYRTEVSGVRKEDVTSPDAADPKAARADIAGLLKGRILVGHAVGNDLRVLRITHPRKDTRDTADYYKRLWRKHGKRGAAPPALRQIVAKVLGVDQFQTQHHDSCEDARAALALYKKASKEWEGSRRKI